MKVNTEYSERESARMRYKLQEITQEQKEFYHTKRERDAFTPKDRKRYNYRSYKMNPTENQASKAVIAYMREHNGVAVHKDLKSVIIPYSPPNRAVPEKWMYVVLRKMVEGQIIERVEYLKFKLNKHYL